MGETIPWFYFRMRREIYFPSSHRFTRLRHRRTSLPKADKSGEPSGKPVVDAPTSEERALNISVDEKINWGRNEIIYYYMKNAWMKHMK